MSIYCANCGSVIPDGAQVCGVCGAAADLAPAQYGTPYDSATQGFGNAGVQESKNDEMMKSIKKYAPIAGGAAALIVVLIVVLSIISANAGYKGALKKIGKAYIAADSETLLNYTSKLAFPYSDDEDINDVYTDVIDAFLEASLDEIEDKVGTIKSIKIKVEDAEKLDDAAMKKLFKKTCGSDYDDDDNLVIDLNSVKQVVKVNLTVTIKGSSKTKEYSIKKLYMVKESGGWKFLIVKDTTNKLPKCNLLYVFALNWDGSFGEELSYDYYIDGYYFEYRYDDMDDILEAYYDVIKSLAKNL